MAGRFWGAGTYVTINCYLPTANGSNSNINYSHNAGLLQIVPNPIGVVKKCLDRGLSAKWIPERVHSRCEGLPWQCPIHVARRPSDRKSWRYATSILGKSLGSVSWCKTQNGRNEAMKIFECLTGRNFRVAKGPHVWIERVCPGQQSTLSITCCGLYCWRRQHASKPLGLIPC